MMIVCCNIRSKPTFSFYYKCIKLIITYNKHLYTLTHFEIESKFVICYVVVFSSIQFMSWSINAHATTWSAVLSIWITGSHSCQYRVWAKFFFSFLYEMEFGPISQESKVGEFIGEESSRAYDWRKGIIAYKCPSHPSNIKIGTSTCLLLIHLK
jgi:hypothetical protein